MLAQMISITPQTLSLRDLHQVMNVSSFFPPQRETFRTILHSPFHLDSHTTRPEERRNITSEVEIVSDDT